MHHPDCDCELCTAEAEASAMCCPYCDRQHATVAELERCEAACVEEADRAWCEAARAEQEQRR